MLDEAKILTDLPGINEPGAEHVYCRMLHYAKETHKQYMLEAENALGENTKAFAREMAGMMKDQLTEIKNRLTVLSKHYEVKLEEIREAYQALPLEDYVDIQRVETRISLRLNHINHALDHAEI